MTTNEKASKYYTGGEQPANAGAPKQLPITNIKDEWSLAEGYIASDDLVAAVNVAITLGRPLLVTGEPGTGKSDLAKSVAYDLGLGQPLDYVIKSDTESRDLFYAYDTVGRFHATQSNGATRDHDPETLGATAFITYNALGDAIMRSNPPQLVKRYRRAGTNHDDARRSVVLIDEIDKAPRDVPNDILSEIDRLEFEIPELSLEAGEPVRVKADTRFRPIVIITSNLEKSLPDAFLRRCVYYHMKFPESDQLQNIVKNRLGDLYAANNQFVASALSLFAFFRDEHLGLSKKPATAELLDWLYVLFNSVPGGAPPRELRKHPRFLDCVRCVLLKNQVDQDRAEALINSWIENQN